MSLAPKHIPQNTHFIGRTFEHAVLDKISKERRARILVTYGRRRVGKTARTDFCK